jgi:hypothetical protein
VSRIEFKPGLFFWARQARNSTAEVDFLAVKNGEIYPVEVKSGASGSLRSLHLCLQTFPNCPAGLVLSTRQYNELPEQKLTFLPLYAAATIGDQRWNPSQRLAHSNAATWSV